MKKHQLSALILCVILLFSLASCGGKEGDYSSRIPDASDMFYVLDTAEVITSATRNHIVSRNDALFAMTGAQVVVACVPSTEGMDIGEYAMQMFNKWGIGSAERNNGVLILLTIQDDTYWVLQGKGLEELLPSGTLKQMVNADLEPHFAAKDYDAGVLALFNSVCAHLSSVYNVTLDTWSGAPGPYNPGGTEVTDNSGSGTIDILIWAVLFVIVILVIAAYFNSASGSGPKNHGGGGGGYRRPRSTPYIGRSYGGYTHRPMPPRPGNYGPRPGGFSGGSRPGGFSGGIGGRTGGSFGGRSGGGGISRGGGVGRR